MELPENQTRYDQNIVGLVGGLGKGKEQPVIIELLELLFRYPLNQEGLVTVLSLTIEVNSILVSLKAVNVIPSIVVHLLAIGNRNPALEQQPIHVLSKQLKRLRIQLRLAIPVMSVT